MQYVARSCASRRRPMLVSLVCASLVLSVPSAKAILFYQTGDPNYNTTAPGGSLTNSGWQFEGLWGSFLGTPIALKYFITAKHVGGSVGDVFNWKGVGYRTTAVYDNPDSDLRIWRICGTFPEYAALYTNTNEVGQGLVVFGRGTRRDVAVTTSTTNVLGQVTVKTNGWQWGASDGVVRWGENLVTAIQNGDELVGSGTIGEVLQATFDEGGGPNECHLSVGDSAGGLFIRDGAVWQLAGINYAVEGPYNTTNSGQGFNAAIFDGLGLFEQTLEGIWVPASGPSSFYATRISAHLSWINSVLNGPVPDDGTPILQSAVNVSGTSYVDETSAVVDVASKTVTVAQPSGTRFFRLRACGSLTIGTIHVQGANLVLTYQ